MEPGTVFVLENAGQVGEKESVLGNLSLPAVRHAGPDTRKQMAGLLPRNLRLIPCQDQFFINEEESLPQTVLTTNSSRDARRAASCRSGNHAGAPQAHPQSL